MIVNNKFIDNISKMSGTQPTPIRQRLNNHETDFGKILKDKVEQTSDVKFSKHAELRLLTRNINLSQLQKDKINAAVSKAEQKGIKDSLVVIDNLAFVVNVKNRTVITAANSSELKDNIFTNIDGAVFA